MSRKYSEELSRIDEQSGNVSGRSNSKTVPTGFDLNAENVVPKSPINKFLSPPSVPRQIPRATTPLNFIAQQQPQQQQQQQPDPQQSQQDPSTSTGSITSCTTTYLNETKPPPPPVQPSPIPQSRPGSPRPVGGKKKNKRNKRTKKSKKYAKRKSTKKSKK